MIKYRYVDALRGLAILAVLIVHCGQFGTNGSPGLFQELINNGARGVQLFYVASAFTLFLSLKSRTEPTSQNFFIRRFFRIAPMYYLAIAYYLFQDGFGPRYWLGDQPEVTHLNILSNIFFVHGFNPYWITSIVPGGWSIAVEVLFYCMVPVLFQLIKNLNHAVIFLIVTLLLSILFTSIFNSLPLISDQRLWGDFLYLSFPSQLPVFACGIILFFLVTETRWTIHPGTILGLTIFLIMSLATKRSLIPIHIQFSICFIFFAYALSLKPFKLFVNRITVYIGKISYSMYLVHFAVLYWMTRLQIVDFIQLNSKYHYMTNYCIRLLVLTGLTVIISSITYRLIEVPFQNLGRSIINQFRFKFKSL